MSQAQPQDLIKFGFIPEFIGRLPVHAVLEELDKDALVQILTRPKNAIVRQYQKLFEFENVRLKFSDDALEAIADLALERKVGARGLRMILEDLMLDLMYYLPSYKKVREFLVTREMVLSQKISLTTGAQPPGCHAGRSLRLRRQAGQRSLLVLLAHHAPVIAPDLTVTYDPTTPGILGLTAATGRTANWFPDLIPDNSGQKTWRHSCPRTLTSP